MPKNIAVLERLLQKRTAVDLETLQRELQKVIKSKAEILKCLMQAESLGFIEKKENRDGFAFRITNKGNRVLRKYLQLLATLNAEEKCVSKARIR